MNTKILLALQCAVSKVDPELHEEQGGFIIHNTITDDFEFHLVTNMNHRHPIASGLYTANPDEYAEKILGKTLASDKKQNWVEYASFHTHPVGFGPFPSRMDLTQLFTSFPINYIYSPDTQSLMEYTYNKEDKKWQLKPINLTNQKS